MLKKEKKDKKKEPNVSKHLYLIFNMKKLHSKHRNISKDCVLMIHKKVK